MAKYLIKASAYVAGVHHSADVRNPRVLTLPNDVEPATSWDPMDKAAQDALVRLAKKKLEALPEAARKKLSKADIERRIAPKPIVGAVSQPKSALLPNGLPRARKAHQIVAQTAPKAPTESEQGEKREQTQLDVGKATAGSDGDEL